MNSQKTFVEYHNVGEKERSKGVRFLFAKRQEKEEHITERERERERES